MIDIAQDLLLRDLDESGVIDHLAFKGGTALRKLYAGSAGRFSTDLDFSVRSAGEDMGAVVELLVEAIEGTECGPFRYGIRHRRGKPYVTIESDLGNLETLTCKLDVNPPPWLPTERRAWAPMPIHARYGGPLPELNVIQIEENIAEKIARLNRVTPARDAYDLVWIMRNRPRLGRRTGSARRRREPLSPGPRPDCGVERRYLPTKRTPTYSRSPGTFAWPPCWRARARRSKRAPNSKRRCDCARASVGSKAPTGSMRPRPGSRSRACCPTPTGRPSWDAAGKVITLPVKLEPNHSYEFWLNRGSLQAFRTVKGVPLASVHVTFSTGPAR